MKQRHLVLANLALITLLSVSGCNKIDLNERCKITISGNTSDYADFNMTYEVWEGVYPGFIGNDCQALIHTSVLQLNIQPEATLEIHLQLGEWNEFFPEGTFNVVKNECEEGLMASFTPAAQGKAIYSLLISSGKMKVKEDEGTYDINIDFRISASSGGGTMTGNFTGTLVQE